MDIDGFALHPADARLHDGRLALVTGATSGIGRGAVFELAAHGAAVAVGFRGDPDEARRMSDAITEAGGTAAPIRIDVGDEESVAAGFAAARDQLGDGRPVDLLVANAGVENDAPLVDMELEDFELVLRTNLTGAFLCAREAARGLRAAEQRGVLVFMSSVHEDIPWPGFAHYAASKGGLKLFVQTIARELAPDGIRAVSVAPGAIETPINDEVLDDPDKKQEVLDEIPWGRWGTVDDVARAVAWVASAQADYVVGSTLFVDGGMTLYPKFV